MKKYIGRLFVYLLLSSSVCLPCGFTQQAESDPAALSKRILEGAAGEGLYLDFEALQGFYLKDNKFQEFVELLKSLGGQNKALAPYVDYYIGLSRYRQLKYLEEEQLWDEYFSLGNTYRQELTDSLLAAIGATSAKDTIHLYARLILWQFHRDQQDAFNEQALTDLVNAGLEFTQSAKDLTPIRDVADALLAYGEKARAKQLYKLYVGKTVTSDIKDETLYTIALDFYKKQNIELSELMFDAYMKKIAQSFSKESLVAALTDVAALFSYKTEGPKDAVYAESVFQKIEEAGGKEAFDGQLLYTRAFNAEKAKEFTGACGYYVELIQRFPESPSADEACFKAAMLYTYALRDAKKAREYFETLARKEAVNPQVISSLYQLGLLSQWEGDPAKAKEYYNLLLEKAKGGFTDTLGFAGERMREIDEAKPIEYNLKTFLDVSLKEEHASFTMGKVDLSASSYTLKQGQEIDITAVAYTPETGCMQVELQYLWSGSLGTQTPSSGASAFSTAYPGTGTKAINLVVVSSAGIIDRAFDMVDVY